ncbi:HAMP domain-containing histidine kinase [Deferribacter autotrophicus]|uniref:histidine kinase n=1 Tax=Deferribacter autotrophicus TaxID=500465 RepID=A0A5A8F4Z3_9BACT|nr:HAMP domain-containing sensor histidine kinase [Deferribacter autotrophicus]KAA0259057.1 HAMP domain-containing histidine kinase [Deferribacter autotrophicus]
MEYLKRFKILVIIGIILSVAIFTLHLVSSFNSLKYMKKNLIELGKFITYSFEVSNRFLFLNSRVGSKRFQEFSKEFLSNEAIYNLIIYDKSGKILLNGKNKVVKFKKIYPKAESIIETDDYIIIVRKVERRFGMGMMGMMRHMQERTNQEFYVALFLDKCSYNYFKKKMLSDLLQMIVLYLFMVIILLYSYRLFRLYAVLTNKLKRIERNAELGKFASLLAHEIKNPLSSMKGLLEFTLDKETDLKQKEILSKVKDEMERLNSLVNDFLTFGREVSLRKNDCNILQLIDETINLLRYDIDNKKLKISIEKEPFVINVDKNRMIQVLMNLILNAIDASKVGDKIKIIVKDKKVIIINNVYNNDDINKEKIFEPFYTTRSKGSGLGLAIVKKIMEMHGYRVYVESVNPFKIVLDFGNGR